MATLRGAFADMLRFLSGSVDENGGTVDHVTLGTLVRRRRKGSRIADSLLRRRIQQLVAAAVDLVAEHAPAGIHGDLVGDVALALEVVGGPLVARRRLVHRPLWASEPGGDLPLDGIGVAGWHWPAAHRRAGRRCRRRRPFLIGAEAVYRRARRAALALGLRRWHRLRQWLGFRLRLWFWFWLWQRLWFGFGQGHQLHGYGLAHR